MSISLNRRKFFGGTVLASGMVGLPPVLAALLREPDVAAKVFAVLQEHLHLEDRHRPVAQAFARSLQTATVHHESAAVFAAKVRSGLYEDELELYILQEFVVSTNYLAYARGKDATLVMVKV